MPDFAAFCEALSQRSRWAFLLNHPSNRAMMEQAWWPLALALGQLRAQSDRPIVLGILGVQGAGKTTFCGAMAVALELLGWRTLSWSIDDLYKTYADRQRLQAQDPRLVWRGPPGTHDVDLGLETLRALRSPQASTIAIPRFDKSCHGGQGDRVAAEMIQPVDIVLFEGWFVGVKPIDFTTLVDWPAPIFSEDDRAFAQDCNQRLRDYLPLWEWCDRLLILKPTDYQFSKQWRQQAERDRIAAGGQGLSEAEISDFVDYFWKALHPKLFVDPLLAAGAADWVFEFGIDRQLTRVTRSPGSYLNFGHPII